MTPNTNKSNDANNNLISSTLVRYIYISTGHAARTGLCPVHTYPEICENANFVLRIWLASTRIQRIFRPYPEIFESALQSGNTLDARGFSLLERRNTAKRREKPLVQTVEFSENAGPMRCRFIFPESDFDPSNSIGSRNLSVLTSTLIGLAIESSSNRFSIPLSTLFPVTTGHNRNAAAKSRKSFFRCQSNGAWK